MPSQYNDAFDDAYTSEQQFLERDTAKWAASQRMIEPLSKLKPLRKLFVHLNWSYCSTEVCDTRERTLEQFIMGEYYDSDLHGKFVVGKRRDDGSYHEDVFLSDAVRAKSSD